MFKLLNRLNPFSRDEIKAPRRRKTRSDKGFHRRRRSGGVSTKFQKHEIHHGYLYCRTHDCPHNTRLAYALRCKGNYVSYPSFYNFPPNIPRGEASKFKRWQEDMLRNKGWGARIDA